MLLVSFAHFEHTQTPKSSCCIAFWAAGLLGAYLNANIGWHCSKNDTQLASEAKLIVSHFLSANILCSQLGEFWSHFLLKHSWNKCLTDICTWNNTIICLGRLAVFCAAVCSWWCTVLKMVYTPCPSPCVRWITDEPAWGNGFGCLWFIDGQIDPILLIHNILTGWETDAYLSLFLRHTYIKYID